MENALLISYSKATFPVLAAIFPRQTATFWIGGEFSELSGYFFWLNRDFYQFQETSSLSPTSFCYVFITLPLHYIREWFIRTKRSVNDVLAIERVSKEVSG